MDERSFKVYYQFADFYRGNVNAESIYYVSIGTAYLLWVLKRQNIVDFDKMSMSEILGYIENEENHDFVRECICDLVKVTDLSRWSSISREDLEYFIINSDVNDSIYYSGSYEPEFTTPLCIADLALKLLDIQSDDNVVDSCSGLGSFLVNASRVCPDAKYYGLEMNLWNVLVSRIKAEVLNKDITIIPNDCLDYPKTKGGFDKVFSNYPLGMRIRNLSENSEFIKTLKNNIPELMRGTSADWIFNLKLIDLLNKNGKAVAVMTLGGLWNTIDKKIREYFLKTNKIETIITLPSKLLPTTAIPVALIVFNNSKENSGIRFVDASKEFVAERRQNTMTNSNIESILNYTKADCECSKFVENEQIMLEGCSFNPSQYIGEKVRIYNGVPFESLMKNITRGAYSPAREFDKLSSPIPTDFQYLMLANIKNGIIDEELPYLREIPASMDKYCLKTGNLILSKNGYPFKVAVANVQNGRKILANGNLYIIELDEEKVNPYYLKAFFESEIGIASLKSIVVGSTIPNIGMTSLNKLMIPMVSREEQEIIANKYLATMDEIALYKRKIEKAENSLKTIFTIE